MRIIKDKYYYAPKGLAALSAKAIPPRFKRDKRETLTKVLILVYNNSTR